MTTQDAIVAAVDATHFGKASAQKRGRNPKWPYVPVILHATGGLGGGGHQEQIRKRAFETRDEAVGYAQSVIDARRESLARDLAAPNHRALREAHGLPREVATT